MTQKRDNDGLFEKGCSPIVIALLLFSIFQPDIYRETE
jgi:hypothetical protein